MNEIVYSRLGKIEQKVVFIGDLIIVSLKDILR